MRLFIAVHFSDEVKNTLLDAIGSLKKQTASANFTREENLHLTLAFIGESTRVRDISDCIDSLDCKKFSLTVGGCGNFGNLWWVGIEKNPTLSDIAENLQDSLRQKGFSIEKRPFKPHITIAREVAAKGRISLSVPKKSMIVERISLMKSERINGKLTYTEIYGRSI